MNSVEFIDVRPFVAAGQLPSRLIQLHPADKWHTPTLPLAVAANEPPTQWTYVRGGILRISMFPYNLSLQDPTHALAAAVQLGLAIRPPVAGDVHLVIGTPIEEQEQTARVWMGVGVKES